MLDAAFVGHVFAGDDDEGFAAQRESLGRYLHQYLAAVGAHHPDFALHQGILFGQTAHDFIAFVAMDVHVQVQAGLADGVFPAVAVQPFKGAVDVIDLVVVGGASKEHRHRRRLEDGRETLLAAAQGLFGAFALEFGRGALGEYLQQ